MSSLTTEYTEVGRSSMGTSYSQTYYQIIYAKYSRTEAQRKALKSTLWVKVVASNTGTHQHMAYGYWVGTLTGSLNTSYQVYGQVYGDAPLTAYEGSIEITHSSDGTASVTVGAYGLDGPLPHNPSSISSVTYSLPTIVLNPTISINGSGASSSNRLTMLNSQTSMSINLGNTQGASTSISINGTSLATFTGDGSKTISIPIGVWNASPNNDNADFALTASNSNGSASTTAYLNLSSSIGPTISSVTLSGTNQFSGLNLTGYSIPVITTSANTNNDYGATITKYELRNLTGAPTGILPKQITSSFTGTLPFNATSVSATIRVYDSRGHYADHSSNTLTVKNYTEPVLNVTGQRCTQSGTINEEGRYIKITATYSVTSVKNGSTEKNSATLQYSKDGNNWTNISHSGLSGTATVIVGTYETTESGIIYVRLVDGIPKTNTSLIQVTPAFTTVSFHNGGKGVAIGQVATQNGFHSYMKSYFHDGIYINNTLVLYDDGQ